jgi:alkanesulfonate monooxygenase SsuD/methylene tetrahydromethanopterin reductase-like flavin-dependent oxidoreductase (luciferase family)
VAKYADIWNFVGGDIETFNHKMGLLDTYCQEIGRDPASIERSIQMLATPDDLAASRDAIRPYIAAGASHIILNLRAPYPEGIVHRMAEEIAGPLAAEQQ